MIAAPFPDNETLRTMALERTGLLDSAPDPVLDSLASTAASICDVPIALVCLVDKKRQWFKSCIGLEVEETSRDVAFCAHAILHPKSLLEIEDATLDPRFCGNPLVLGDPNIRFYAGQPLLTSDGFALGTLCVIGRESKTLTNLQRKALKNLASIATNLIEERSTDRANLIRKLAGQSSMSGIFTLDASKENFPIFCCNKGFEEISGKSQEELVGKSIEAVYGDLIDQASLVKIHLALKAHSEVTVRFKDLAKHGLSEWTELTVSPVPNADGDVTEFLAIQREVTGQYAPQNLANELSAVVDASFDEVFVIDEATFRPNWPEAAYLGVIWNKSRTNNVIDG